MVLRQPRRIDYGCTADRATCDHSAGGVFAARQVSATGIAGAKAALDADGNAIAVWSHYDGKKWRVQERRISATGSLGPVKTISAAADKPLWPQIAGNPDGGAIVVWSRTRNRAEHPRGFDSRIEARRISANGRLGQVKAVSTRGRRAGGPRIASDARGNAIVTWQQRKQGILRIKARRISSHGALGRVQTLSSGRHKAEGPVIASGAHGDAIVAWTQPDSTAWRIRAQRISAKGRLGSVKTLSAPGHGAGLTEVSSDARGDAVVVWSQFDSKESIRRIKARRISAKGAVGRMMTLSPAQEYGLLAQVASDARGDTIVVWKATAPRRARSLQRVLSAPRKPSRLLGKSDTRRRSLSTATATRPRSGTRPTTPIHTQRGGFARRISVAGALGQMQTLATEPIRNTAIAVNPEGNAFAAWTQFNGSTWREWGSQGP